MHFVDFLHLLVVYEDNLSVQMPCLNVYAAVKRCASSLLSPPDSPSSLSIISTNQGQRDQIEIRPKVLELTSIFQTVVLPGDRSGLCTQGPEMDRSCFAIRFHSQRTSTGLRRRREQSPGVEW